MSANPEHADKLGDSLMRLFWSGRPAASNVAERTRRRVWVHLIPVLFFLYILAYLDRANISVAQLGMIKSPEEGGLGFTNDIIGWGIGLFFFGYWILEIPSTLSVERRGARWVFCRILILWGLSAALLGTIGLPFARTMFDWIPVIPETIPGLRDTAHYINGLRDNSAYQYYFFRFMLGFFEGGFFPSVIMYLSIWFRSEDRARAIASFMAAIPLSSFVGNPLSGTLLKFDWLNLPGWRWIFILEGIAPVIAGIGVLFCLPDNPTKAKWLSDEEREWLKAELDREHHAKKASGHGALVQHAGMVLLLTVVYFCHNVAGYGMSMFMPAIIKAQAGSSDVMSSVLSGLLYLVAFVAILLNGWHSDRTGERVWHVAIPLAGLSAGIFLAALTNNVTVVPLLILILVVGGTIYTHLPAFWPIPTMFLGSAAAASAIGFVNMVGNIGGFLGPYIVGESAKGGGEAFVTAMYRIAGFPLVAAVIILAVSFVQRRHGTRIAGN